VRTDAGDYVSAADQLPSIDHALAPLAGGVEYDEDEVLLPASTESF
jgi:hypothetical protein